MHVYVRRPSLIAAFHVNDCGRTEETKRHEFGINLGPVTWTAMLTILSLHFFLPTLIFSFDPAPVLPQANSSRLNSPEKQHPERFVCSATALSSHCGCLVSGRFQVISIGIVGSTHQNKMIPSPAPVFQGPGSMRMMYLCVQLPLLEGSPVCTHI
jgi:hypothetical protein